MKSKKWLFALLLGSFALTASACGDDAGGSQDVQSELTYKLTCASPNTCTLTMEPNQDGLITVQLSSLDKDGKTNFVPGVQITATTQSNAVSIVTDANPQVTDALGQYALRIHSGSEEGLALFTFNPDPAYPALPLTFAVTVRKPEVVTPQPAVTNYEISAIYNGTQNLNYAEVMLFEDTQCAELVTTGMTSDELKAITAPDPTLKQSKAITTTIDEVTFNISREEADFTSYAALAIAQAGGVMVAYGCNDGLSRNVPNTVIALSDAQLSENPDVDPGDDPTKPPIIDPDKPEPEIPELDYKGTFELTSSFNALSLLPHAETDGSFVMFKDMLVGDWIEFALDMLSDPEGTVPKLLTEQLLPLLLDAEWFSNLVGKLLGDSVAALLTPETINALFSQFGLDKIIKDTLTELTAQISWWNTATGAVEIVNNLATNFTLHGNFSNNAYSTLDANQSISGIGHNYQRLLYHNGGIPINGKDCIVGQAFEDLKDGSTICSISLTDIEGGGVIRGAFTANFSDIDEYGAGATVNIQKHALDLAYGRLIYGVLMNVLPEVLGNDKLDSLGGVLEHYIGMGLLALWNKNHPDQQITDKTSCAAIGEVASGYLNELLGSNESIATIIAMFANGSTIGALCTKGIEAFDGMIETQLDKLSVSTDKVNFSSDPCQVSYVTDKSGHPTKIAEFGQEHPWGSTATDNRCIWNVSIVSGTDDAGTPETMTIKGRFHAVGLR